MLFLGIWQEAMPPVAWNTAAVGLWMAVWWMTEAVPVPVTAFLPLVSFDILGIASIKEAAAPYAHPIIYLFLGAFILALAVQRWNLHKRIALFILSYTGTEGIKLVGSFMLIAALLSMWISNTSTTMMLLPIAISVLAIITENVSGISQSQTRNFQISMMLGLAFAATIGGMSTLIGTPPNAFLAAYLLENYAIEIGFAQWMMVGIPISMILLPLTWLTLTRLVFPVDIPASQATSDHLQQLKDGLGTMTVAEKRIAILFSLVVISWILRKPLTEWLQISGISDSGIVMTAALLSFMIPSGNAEQPWLMTWKNAAALPWGVLILFGGGLSLAAAVSSSGLAEWLGNNLVPLASLGIFALILASTALVIFLTELTSNLATTATMLPVVAALATQLGIDPMILLAPVTLAASCAFMLPVATAPNAIIYSSGMLHIPDMIRAGILINLLGLALLTAVALWWVPIILG